MQDERNFDAEDRDRRDMLAEQEWEMQPELPQWMDDDLFMMNANEADDYRNEGGEDW